MRFRTLSQRLFLIAAIALMPAILIVAVGIVQLQRAAETALHEKAFRSAELAGLELERIVSGAEYVLLTLSATPIVRRGDYSECSDLMARVRDRLPFLASVTVINPDGVVRCVASATNPPLYLGDRQYFLDAMASSDRVVGTFTVGRLTGRNVLPVALKIGGTDGAPLGVAVAYIDLTWLEKLVEDRTHEEGSSLTIADRDGTILARAPMPEKFVGMVIPAEYQYLLQEPAIGTLALTSQDGTRRVLGYVPLAQSPYGLYISAGHSTHVAYAPFFRVILTAGGITLAGILTAMLATRYTSQRFIVRPVGQLIGTIAAWRAGNENARTGMNKRDGEICEAGETFDAFVGELLENRAARAAAEAHTRLLSAELDHRVKNLLTMVQIIARQTFGNGGQDGPLKTFNARLMAIGEANNTLRKSDWQSVDLSKLIATGIAPFTDPERGRVAMSGPAISVKGNVALSIAMAVHELATNASKYGALSSDSGRISIEWSETPSSEGAQFVLCWRETGGPPPVPPTQTGFGSKVIHQALAGQLGGKVEVTYADPGLVCRVTAPAANVRDA